MDATDIGGLVLRVALGVTMFAHGWNHVFRGGKIAGTGRWFTSIGMRHGRLNAWLASVTELVAGGLLIIGLATPLAAAAVMGTMLVALIANHIRNGFFIFRPGEGYEYVLMITLVAAALAAVGPGRLSVDNLAGIDASGWAAFGIAVAVGVASGLGVLALFWRPQPRDKPADN